MATGVVRHHSVSVSLSLLLTLPLTLSYSNFQPIFLSPALSITLSIALVLSSFQSPSLSVSIFSSSHCIPSLSHKRHFSRSCVLFSRIQFSPPVSLPSSALHFSIFHHFNFSLVLSLPLSLLIPLHPYGNIFISLSVIVLLKLFLASLSHDFSLPLKFSRTLFFSLFLTLPLSISPSLLFGFL